jgi:serine/threonine protein kinase/WD40 repeat protein/tetratricopeptide (TPR) repeat protein
MASSSAERNPVEQLAEEFAERFRRGERPALTEYTERYPELADEIRELFPALVVMEQLKPAGEATGPDGVAVPHGPPLHTLGDYHILREVGRGGMGVVYEAEQVSLGRHVALKVLPAQALVNPTYLERFRREAKAAARLHHTNIVPVYGVGEGDGVYFYAMQFIAGDGLDKVLRDLRRLRRRPGAATEAGPASGTAWDASIAHSLVTGGWVAGAEGRSPGEAPEASSLSPGHTSRAESSSPTLSGAGSEGGYYRSVARIGVQVADALGYAHRQGILHRDIKPSNLLLDAQGTVWITDFGLAKSEGADELTHTGDIVGTVRFMAPERFDGRSLPQSDVYGLGLTLYELLTLRPAFDDPNRARLIERVLHEPPAPPRKVEPHVPRDLETVVLKCLAKEPAERYASAEALAEDLRRFLADRPIKARRTPWHERTWRWCRRNPAVASLLAAVAVLLVVGTAVSTFEAMQANRALAQTQAAERQARLREADALVGQAHGIRYSRQMGQRFDALAALKKAAAIGRELGQPPEWFDGLRNEAIAALALPDLRVAREWEGWPSGTANVNFDSKLERYARVDRQGNVSVRRVSDDQELWQLPPSGPGGTWLLFSPDGRFLWVEASRHVRVWNLAGQEPVQFFEATGQCPDFSPDSRWLAVKHRDDSIGLYDLASGREIKRLGNGLHPNRLAFHPRKLQLAISTDTKTQILDLETGRLLAELPQPGDWLTWSPDGKALATSEGLLIHVWDVPTRQETARLEACRNFGIVLFFDHAGDLLVSTGWEGMVRFWDPHTGKQLFSTPASTTSVLHFSPDDRLVAAAVAGTRLRIWEVAHGHEYRTLAPKQTGHNVLNVWSAALSLDGRLLAVGTQAGIVLWDAARGSEVGIVGCGLTTCMVFEPPGALLANGPTGLRRWPVREDPADPGQLRLGPPEELPVPGSNNGIAISRDGGVVASAQGCGAFVLHRDQPGQLVRLFPHQDTRSVAVSPDGRWVATGSYSGTLVKVWEARTGKLATTLPIDRGSGVVFSPDGKWLATSADGVRLWALGSWQEGPSFEGGAPAFSPDGRLLALETGQGVIRLLDVGSGREHARLEDPDHDRARFLFFSADGTRLVVPSNDSQTVHVWDLRKIRSGLRELELDWDAPEYPPVPAGTEDSARPPLRLRVETGDLEDEVLLGANLSREQLVNVILGNSLLLGFSPLDYKAYRQRGRAYGRLSAMGVSGAARPAIADYSAALALLPSDDPGRVDLLRRRAGNYVALGEYDEALADIRRVERLDPTRGPSTRAALAAQLLQLAARRKDRAAALADLRAALELVPDYAEAHNNLAWLLLTGPQEPGVPEEALRHARQAVDLTADQAIYLNTLGVALYRSGKVAEAVPVLEKSLAAAEGQSDAFDLFFLAMCYAKQSDTARAKDCFDRAVKWCDEHMGLPARQMEELKAFRAEAEAVLGSR